ncbi:MAG: HlyD family efflux transporter periplasmic adaptor subunit [Nitrospirae bacterium]|nr:MAG: HlyD family efflux transporter periplasmic adaptor subunit [Nitrospirota bacterium]
MLAMLQLAPQETRFRQDLIVVSQQTLANPEDPAFVVKDPETGKFFRFHEVEHFIAQQLDGSAALEEIRHRVEERFHAPLSPDTLERFIKTLRRLGLLEESKDSRKSPVSGRGRFHGTVLYFRISLFDPNRLFDRLIGKIRFFFTPYFLACSAALILFAAGLAIVNWDEISQDASTLFRIDTIFWIWLTVLVVTTFHEFAHGLTCKHFGGEVHEVGFLLMYFQPCLYCNVSDAWLFPEKSKRLWVTFAGPYFEFCIWALATIVWRITDQETWLNQLALVVMATSGVQTFLDFNPLMKRDGYYFLSDYLDMPNLRKRAFRYSGAVTKRLFGVQDKSAISVTPREQRIYLVYGLVAGAFSFSVLSAAALFLGSFLIDNYRGAGFALFSAILPVIFRKPVKKSIAYFPALVKSVPEKLASLGRSAMRLGVVAALLAAVFLVHLDLTVWGQFRIVPLQNTDIRAEVEGIIMEIFVKEQDRVRKGDVIARLSDRDNRAELQRTEAQIDQSRAKLKLLKAGPRREEIEVASRAVDTARSKQEQAKQMRTEQLAKAESAVDKTEKLYEQAKQMRAERLANAQSAVEKAEERLNYQKKDLERYKGILKAGHISRSEYEVVEEEEITREKELEAAGGSLKLALADNLSEIQKELGAARGDLKLVLANDLAEFRHEVAVAEKELDMAKGQLKVLLAGSRLEEIEATEAEIAGLEGQRRYLLEQLRLLNAVSPVDGTITTPTRQLNEMTGQHVSKGDLIAEVHDLTTVTAEISVSEKEIADVAVGQDVVLKARSYPEKTFEGKVVAIATTAAQKADGGAGSTVLVLTQLDNSSLLLKPDMTGNAKILCGKRPVFALATRRIARYFRVEVWSWW